MSRLPRFVLAIERAVEALALAAPDPTNASHHSAASVSLQLDSRGTLNMFAHHKPSDTLHVIAVVSNPARFESRYRLCREFLARIASNPRVQLHTVEVAHGFRAHAVTGPSDIQLRSDQELWQKEAMINVALKRLPHDWRYVAWVDADVQFVRPDWAEETIHQLQHFKFVQMFEHAIDLGPAGEALEQHTSLGSLVQAGKPTVSAAYYYSPGQKIGHPGFAWAATRDALDSVGGLFDEGILGASDHHMARALVGDASQAVPAEMHPNYHRLVKQWQARATEHIRGSYGAVGGVLLHHWHGRKADRQYHSRWQILVRHNFDPLADMYKDTQGLWRLHGNKPGLRDDVRRYFRSRFEDANQV